jgi:hypothetical protein
MNNIFKYLMEKTILIIFEFEMYSIQPFTFMSGRNIKISFSSALNKFIHKVLLTLTYAMLVGVIMIVSTQFVKASKKQKVDNDIKKVVFVAGERSHGYGAHEHRAGCELLARLLEENTDNIITKVYSEGWPENEDAFEGADAIVLFSDGGPKHMVIPHLESLNKYMERGVGLGIIHYAVVVPPGKAGNYFLDWIGGFFETDWSVNPFWTAKFENIPRNEVTKGVNSFEIYDEWYYHMRFIDDIDKIQPILSALPPESTLTREDGPYSNNPYVREAVKERKEPQHVMWLFERTKMPGRSFGHTGGHYHWEWGNPDFRTVTLNAIMWIAGMEIPKNGISTPVLTIEDLLVNQDYEQPDNFDLNEIKKQLKEWQAGHKYNKAVR